MAPSCRVSPHDRPSARPPMARAGQDVRRRLVVVAAAAGPGMPRPCSRRPSSGSARRPAALWRGIGRSWGSRWSSRSASCAGRVHGRHAPSSPRRRCCSPERPQPGDRPRRAAGARGPALLDRSDAARGRRGDKSGPGEGEPPPRPRRPSAPPRRRCRVDGGGRGRAAGRGGCRPRALRPLDQMECGNRVADGRRRRAHVGRGRSPMPDRWPRRRGSPGRSESRTSPCACRSTSGGALPVRARGGAQRPRGGPPTS